MRRPGSAAKSLRGFHVKRPFPAQQRNPLLAHPTAMRIVEDAPKRSGFLGRAAIMLSARRVPGVIPRTAVKKRVAGRKVPLRLEAGEPHNQRRETSQVSRETDRDIDRSRS